MKVNLLKKRGDCNIKACLKEEKCFYYKNDYKFNLVKLISYIGLSRKKNQIQVKLQVIYKLLL